MYTLIFRDGVPEEIQLAYWWYEKQRVGLGDELLNEFDKAFTLLKNNPQYFSFIYKSRRKLTIKRFPYKIIYEIFDDTVVIFTVRHSKQKPKF